jgi:hypothetical protein
MHRHSITDRNMIDIPEDMNELTMYLVRRVLAQGPYQLLGRSDIASGDFRRRKAIKEDREQHDKSGQERLLVRNAENKGEDEDESEDEDEMKKISYPDPMESDPEGPYFYHEALAVRSTAVPVPFDNLAAPDEPVHSAPEKLTPTQDWAQQLQTAANSVPTASTTDIYTLATLTPALPTLAPLPQRVPYFQPQRVTYFDESTGTCLGWRLVRTREEYDNITAANKRVAEANQQRANGTYTISNSTTAVSSSNSHGYGLRSSTPSYISSSTGPPIGIFHAPSTTPGSFHRHYIPQHQNQPSQEREQSPSQTELYSGISQRHHTPQHQNQANQKRKQDLPQGGFPQPPLSPLKLPTEYPQHKPTLEPAIAHQHFRDFLSSHRPAQMQAFTPWATQGTSPSVKNENFTNHPGLSNVTSSFLTPLNTSSLSATGYVSPYGDVDVKREIKPEPK